ncbi:FecR domain-containing protein [Sandaracinus amylolyticus]|uniref:FecR protein domain-containing protein n=1 Tax=Sandaracinus amylolyticus TaxID=927083 RepID=A0A0F6YKD4_9BACT|nr:FecR domain-containing protein [Sandaracinus amylolyticus]AKF08216.1 hypothetical protein DB32_005365 [Sandaracinus amylolyticus]
MRFFALAALLITACGGGEDERPPRSASAPQAAVERHAGEPVEVIGTPPDQPPARLARATGDVLRSRGPIEAGAPLEAGDGLVVRGEGRADVDLGDGGRVSLGPDTELRIGDGGPAQVVLLEGSLHAAVPAGPAGPRPPLRIATAHASIDLGGSGELFVRAHRTGTWVASLAGLGTVATGEVDGRRRLRVIELPPGRAIFVGARLAEPTDGPTRLDDARSAAVTIFEGAAEPEAARLTRELDDAASRLDESLLWLEAETRRGLDLTTQHREAVRAGRADEGMRLQRELVTHSQQLYALRQVATARWERLHASALATAHVPGTTPSTHAETRRDRVASLLGL